MKKLLKERLQKLAGIKLQEQLKGMPGMAKKGVVSTFHVYDGCGLSGYYTGTGNTFDNAILNQIANANNSPYAYMNDLIGPTSYSTWGDYIEWEYEVSVNNNIIHQAFGSPSPGQVVQFKTCPPASTICQPTCMRYVGTTSWNPSQVASFAGGASLTNPTPVLFNSCQACSLNVNGETVIPYGVDPDDPILNGCTDLNACNYSSIAINDDGSCIYPEFECWNGILACSESECMEEPDPIYGCTDLNADNYNSDATIDDGSCEYLGCTDPDAINYDSSSNVDDGSCDYSSSDLDTPVSGVDLGIADGAFCCDQTANNYAMNTIGTLNMNTMDWPVEGPGFGGNFVDTYLMLGGYPQGNFSLCGDHCEYDKKMGSNNLTPLRTRLQELANIRKKK